MYYYFRVILNCFDKIDKVCFACVICGISTILGKIKNKFTRK